MKRRSLLLGAAFLSVASCERRTIRREPVQLPLPCDAEATTKIVLPLTGAFSSTGRELIEGFNQTGITACQEDVEIIDSESTPSVVTSSIKDISDASAGATLIGPFGEVSSLRFARQYQKLFFIDLVGAVSKSIPVRNQNLVFLPTEFFNDVNTSAGIPVVGFGKKDQLNFALDIANIVSGEYFRKFHSIGESLWGNLLVSSFASYRINRRNGSIEVLI